MKKFLIAVLALLALLLAADAAYYRFGFYIDFHPNQPAETFMTTDEDTIYMDRGEGPEPFVIRGVNLGAGIPGHWATDYAIDEETYLRWFEQIQEMGANTIRVYTILQSDFYDAFYAYNQDREDPLYLLHGVWVNDYVQNSHLDAYADDFRKVLLQDCRTVVDLLHGNKKLSVSGDLGSGTYTRDVSPWVIGYILGVEWEDVTVAYTDHKYAGMDPYQGTYLTATADATPFESLLAEVGDQIVSYESGRYKQQRLVAFSNWPTTDPFLYPDNLTISYMKCAQVDVEHIAATDAFLSGQFASYHAYPYYPDYLNRVLNPVPVKRRPVWAGKDTFTDPEAGTPYQEALSGVFEEDYLDRAGRVNTYYAYLQMLTRHHTMPVVISEFGVSTGRGMAQVDQNTGRNQGHMTETQQGQALVEMWGDVLDAGCAGGCVFTWQDEWFKRTWNTMYAVDLHKTPYWSDYQTNEQYFGLLSFDPGTERSVCYVDGELSEWAAEDVMFTGEEGTLSMKYDEKFLYILLEREGFSQKAGPTYIPIDTTPKTGSSACRNFDLRFGRDADFLLVIDGRDNSRLLVQERYEVLRCMYNVEINGEDPYVDPPAKDAPWFKPIDLILKVQTSIPLLTGDWDTTAETFETGLLTYGSANPGSPDFNSLADFCFGGDAVEIRLPWQLLNFSNPSEMEIHDDYYENYGVEAIRIRELWAGAGTGREEIAMSPFSLQGWGSKVTYHERLKQSYYILQSAWKEAGT